MALPLYRRYTENIKDHKKKIIFFILVLAITSYYDGFTCINKL
jgi:hypothetical protein